MARVQIERDRYDRPLIEPVGGGKPKAYTRVSNLAKALEDSEALTKWKMRQVMLGTVFGGNEFYQKVMQAELVEDDKLRRNILGGLTGQALDLSRSNEGADWGTAVHAWCEFMDSGEKTLDDVPEEMRPDVAAYVAKMAELGLRRVEAETFVINDEVKAGGSFDGIYAYADKPNGVVGDVKTGSLYWLSVSIQLAIYAHGTRYNPARGGREPESLADLGVDQSMGIVIHVPKGQGICEVHKVDLTIGWEMAQRAIQLRSWRNVKPNLGPFSLT